MRLIDADAFKRQAHIEMVSQCLNAEKIAVFCMLVDMQPTIDPVRHARWVCENGVNVCSGCGGKQHWDDWDELEFTPWCHNCGARIEIT